MVDASLAPEPVAGSSRWEAEGAALGPAQGHCQRIRQPAPVQSIRASRGPGSPGRAARAASRTYRTSPETARPPCPPCSPAQVHPIARLPAPVVPPHRLHSRVSCKNPPGELCSGAPTSLPIQGIADSMDLMTEFFVEEPQASEVAQPAQPTTRTRAARPAKGRASKSRIAASHKEPSRAAVVVTPSGQETREGQ